MKASKQPKESIEPLIAELVALKASYESLAGVPFGGAPSNAAAKKATATPTPTPTPTPKGKKGGTEDTLTVLLMHLLIFMHTYIHICIHSYIHT